MGTLENLEDIFFVNTSTHHKIKKVSIMSLRIPPLLEPYISLPPEASLILLTSVLGASSNWLVLRFLYSTLQSQNASSEPPLLGEKKVLLVSFIRDLGFWKDNGRRLVSILSRKSRDIRRIEVDISN